MSRMVFLRANFRGIFFSWRVGIKGCPDLAALRDRDSGRPPDWCDESRARSEPL